MNFHMDFIKECFPSWVHLKILEKLMQKPQAMSQRQLANLMGIPRATTQRALSDLGETGLLKAKKVGTATYWDIDQQSYLYEALSPILEGLTSLTPPLAYLKKLIQKTLSLPKSIRCLIFGSVIEGKDSSSSDIDIAIILPGKNKTVTPKLKNELDDLTELCREKFGKRLAVLFVNEKELSEKQGKELYRNILKGLEIKK
jgi:predicted nucleotidyltransferase